jgi:hypothetical protein
METGFPEQRPALYVAGDGPPLDPALRLSRFREGHPDIEIILRGPWEAVIPEPDGQRVIVRWELTDLLDAAESRLAARDATSGG